MEFLLFSDCPDYASAADQQGMNAIIVDWERQRFAEAGGVQAHGAEPDLESQQLLQDMRSSCAGHIICRVNHQPERLDEEVEAAIALGADEIWLPMVSRIEQILHCQKRINDRAQLGIMAETPAILSLASELNGLGLSKVFFGLFDYSQLAHYNNLFSALVNGDVDRFREAYHGSFGVAGITDPVMGDPIAQKLLLAEMVRLDCRFAVGRRAFRRDVAVDNISAILLQLRAMIKDLELSGEQEKHVLREQFVSLVGRLDSVSA